MTTGERIKARRLELGMSADTLAEKIGVARSTMFRYEKGDIDKMTLTVIEPIAMALNTTVSYLMGWEDEAPTTSGDECERQAMELFSSLPVYRQVEALNYLRYLATTEGIK